jgi:KipI family sensor histidine kinase inhibitor
MTASYPRVWAVGDRAITVELGDSLDLQTVSRVRALDLRLRERDIQGVLEAVPTYAALLVIYDPLKTSFAELSDELQRLARDLPSTSPAGRLVEISALYDGADLDEVAEGCGMTREGVIDLHSGREYSVLMLGFSPGFAYMGFVDERLRRPRRKTPRTRVPEGAIAIAGPQTGVYPRALPGGWNLLGRTSSRLFDSSKANPSLLLPGDRVRFVETKGPEAAAPTPPFHYGGGDVWVGEAGVLTTIQDSGRPGQRRFAIPEAGYADAFAARTASLCVGNPAGSAVIEVCGPGLRLHFEKTTFVAITGARITAELERNDIDGGRMSVPLNVAVRVRATNVLTVTGLLGGVRGYLAIAGFCAPAVLGSASADLGSGILRPLAAGDGFSVDAFDADRVRRDPAPNRERGDRVRVILGPQAHHFDERTIEAFLGASWTVGLDSDRVGARLDGPPLAHAGSSEIVSDGMVPGCIQVPPDGRPIVMLSDCPTTGGYPKIACVVSDDVWLLAQAIPGQTPIRFTAVQVSEL